MSKEIEAAISFAHQWCMVYVVMNRDKSLADVKASEIITAYAEALAGTSKEWIKKPQTPEFKELEKNTRDALQAVLDLLQPRT